MVSFSPPRHALQRGVEAGGVARREQLLGVGGAARATHLLRGRARSRSSNPSEERTWPLRPSPVDRADCGVENVHVGHVVNASHRRSPSRPTPRPPRSPARAASTADAPRSRAARKTPVWTSPAPVVSTACHRAPRARTTGSAPATATTHPRSPVRTIAPARPLKSGAAADGSAAPVNAAASAALALTQSRRYHARANGPGADERTGVERHGDGVGQLRHPVGERVVEAVAGHQHDVAPGGRQVGEVGGPERGLRAAAADERALAPAVDQHDHDAGVGVGPRRQPHRDALGQQRRAGQVAERAGAVRARVLHRHALPGRRGQRVEPAARGHPHPRRPHVAAARRQSRHRREHVDHHAPDPDQPPSHRRDRRRTAGPGV